MKRAMKQIIPTAIKSFALSLAIVAATPVLSEVYPQPNLRDISEWFNGVETMEAKFQQYNDDGSLDTGTLYIMRPGRLRMQYDRQDALVLVAGGAISIYDGADDADAERYPLRSTPLWHLLRPEVDLGRPGAIKAFGSHKNLTRITAYDDDHPEAGRMILEFDNSDGTIKLDGWKVRTASGEEVNVRLRDPNYGITLPSQLFSVQLEDKRRNPHGGR
jgi:outer membrane lipoprotein-sorting protein